MPKKILIIDDEIDICKAVTEFLFDAGYSTSYALTGNDGLEQVKKELPSLIILDIGLPGMDGIETLRLIREISASLPVVVLTANHDPDLIKKIMRFGVLEYLTKPINLETLLNHFVRDIIGKPLD